jgi:hypothetical protein
VEAIESPGSEAKRWYVGQWGFQFYAERHGFRLLETGSTWLEPGDWVAVPAGVARQIIALPMRLVRLEGVIEARSHWPWSTIPAAYLGFAPIRAQPISHVKVQLYRVRERFQIQAKP